MNKKVFTLTTAILLFFNISTKAADVTIDINAGEINIMGTTMNVPDLERWYYFSFETGDTIGSSEFVLTDLTGGNIGTEVPDAAWTVRTDWDIAFHSTDIRTNGAKAKLIADTTSTIPLADVYAALSEVPTGDYSADEVVAGTFIQSLTKGMPPYRASQMSVCPVTHGWATFGMSTAPSNPMVVVFELADGRYVKVYLKDFVNEEGNPGYINLEYDVFSDDVSTVININDGDYPDFSTWYYFSFETGTVIGTSDFTLENVSGAGIGTEIPSEEWTARTDWDIAFHSTDIRTNGAKAVLVADATSGATSLDNTYADLTSAPVNGYEADGDTTGVFIQSVASMPPPRTTTMSVCKAAHGWATYGMSASEINPMVIVFELTDGKYVKVYLKDFFNENEAPGFIKFEYAEIPVGGSGLSNSTEVKFKIYPNPATEVLNVELAESTIITIYNLSGSMVKQISGKAGTNSITVDNLSAGAYFVNANNQIQKFIVK